MLDRGVESWGLGFAEALARTREAAPGADAGKQMQMLAAGPSSAAWLEMPLAGPPVEEEWSPPPVGGQIKRAGKHQCKYSGWHLSAGQQRCWSSEAASSPPQRPTGSLRAPVPHKLLAPTPRSREVLRSSQTFL